MCFQLLLKRVASRKALEQVGFPFIGMLDHAATTLGAFCVSAMVGILCTYLEGDRCYWWKPEEYVWLICPVCMFACPADVYVQLHHTPGTHVHMYNKITHFADMYTCIAASYTQHTWTHVQHHLIPGSNVTWYHTPAKHQVHMNTWAAASHTRHTCTH